MDLDFGKFVSSQRDIRKLLAKEELKGYWREKVKFLPHGSEDITPFSITHRATTPLFLIF